MQVRNSIDIYEYDIHNILLSMQTGYNKQAFYPSFFRKHIWYQFVWGKE